MEDKSVDFLTYVVRNLVDNPDSVRVDRTVDEMGVLLTLDVHPDDMGKVIGRKGATAKAIRTLLRVVGMKNNARVNMKIREPEGGSSHGYSSDMNGSGADVAAAMEELKADM